MNKTTTPTEYNLHAIDIWQVIKSRKLYVVLSFVLVSLFTLIYTNLQPELYRAHTQFELTSNTKALSVFGTDIGNNSDLARYNYFRTQLAVMESKENLIRVAKRLKLKDNYKLNSDKVAASIVKSNLNIVQKRSTNLVDIYVLDRNPGIAAEIAKAVREEYRKRREIETNDRISLALRDLRKKISSQEELVAERATEMNEIKKRLGITQRNFQGHNNWFGNDVDRSKAEVFSTRNKISDLETQIESLSKLSGDELIRKANTLQIQDSVVTNRYQEYLNLQLQERSLIDAGLGNMHPDMKRVRGQLQKLRNIMLDGVITMKSAWQDQLKLAKNKFSNIRNVEEEVTKNKIDEEISQNKFEQIYSDWEQQKKILDKLKERLMVEEAELEMSRQGLTIHEEAEPSRTPVKPDVKLNMMVGMIAGLIFGIALAFTLEYLDTSIKTVDDVEKYLQLPVIAVVPKGVPLLHSQKGINPDSEAYRILRTNIEFNRQNADANAITVVSGGTGEGKSTTLANLAYICAQGGYTTLMIDADLRRPRLHTYYNVNNSVGLTNYLTSEIDLENVILQTPTDNLYFLPSGVLPTDATAVLNLRKMSQLISEVKNRFDLVLIDSPPILGVSDASVLVCEADLTIIVVQHRKLPRKLIMRVKQAVESVGGNVLGVVLNNVDINTDTQYQYYTSYYTYYSAANNYVDETPEQTQTQSLPTKSVAKAATTDESDEY